MSDLKFQLRSYAPSSANGSLLPAILAAILAAGALAQFGLSTGVTSPLEAGPVRAARWTLPVIGEPGAPAPGAIPWLFTPSRLGLPTGEAASTDGDTATEAPPKPKIGPLSGAWVVGSMRIKSAQAAIIHPPHAPVFRLPVGGTWRGWQLTAIQGNSALFRRSGKTHRINFDTPPPSASDASKSENTSE